MKNNKELINKINKLEERLNLLYDYKFSDKDLENRKSYMMDVMTAGDLSLWQDCYNKGMFNCVDSYIGTSPFYTPLSWAVKRKNNDLIKFCIERGANPFKSIDKGYYSVFDFCLRQGKYEQLVCLLNCSNFHEWKTREWNIQVEGNSFKGNLFHYWCTKDKGEYDSLEFLGKFFNLLKKEKMINGVSVDYEWKNFLSKDYVSDYLNPLEYAVIFKARLVVHCLLENGYIVDLNFLNKVYKNFDQRKYTNEGQIVKYLRTKLSKEKITFTQKKMIGVNNEIS